MLRLLLILLVGAASLHSACEDSYFGGVLYAANDELMSQGGSDAWKKQIEVNNKRIADLMSQKKRAAEKIEVFINIPFDFPHSLDPLLQVFPREQVLAVLHQFIEDPITLEQWEELQRNKQYDEASRWGRRLRAINILGLFCGDEILNRLMSIGTNPALDKAIRFEAIKTLGQVGDDNLISEAHQQKIMSAIQINGEHPEFIYPLMSLIYRNKGALFTTHQSELKKHFSKFSSQARTSILELERKPNAISEYASKEKSRRDLMKASRSK